MVALILAAYPGTGTELAVTRESIDGHVVQREQMQFRIRSAQATHEAEDIAWSIVKDSIDAAVVTRFVEQFPDGIHADEARHLLELLNDRGGVVRPEPTPQTSPYVEQNAPDTILLIQAELKRTGCYAGSVDGVWGNRSRRAVVSFAASAGLSLPSEPTEALLNAVRSEQGIVCAAVTVETRRDELPRRTCSRVGVTVAQRAPSGSTWDFTPSDANPDLLVTDLSSGASVRCQDSFSCSLDIAQSSGTVSLKIVDVDDVSSDDLIGQGECRIGTACVLDDAQVSFSTC